MFAFLKSCKRKSVTCGKLFARILCCVDFVWWTERESGEGWSESERYFALFLFTFTLFLFMFWVFFVFWFMKLLVVCVHVDGRVSMNMSMLLFQNLNKFTIGPNVRQCMSFKWGRLCERLHVAFVKIKNKLPIQSEIYRKVYVDVNERARHS